MMRRASILFAVVASIAILPTLHTAQATPAAKVQVCHLNSSNTPATRTYDYEYHYNTTDLEYHYDYTYSFGRVIEVNENAVDAHVEHGDSTSFGMLTEYLVEYFETWDQYDYSYSYDARPGLDYYYSSSSDFTNGEINNADCYVFSYTTE